MRYALVLLAVFQLSWAATESSIPTLEFVRPPVFHSFALSPDGTHLAHAVNVDGDSRLYIRDLKTMAVTQGVVPENVRFSISQVQWVTDQRVIFSSFNSFWGVDADGGNFSPLSGLARQLAPGSAGENLLATKVIHRFEGKRAGQVLVLDWPADRGGLNGFFALEYPNVSMMNTIAGFHRPELSNPGNVTTWLTDAGGNVRIGAVGFPDTTSLLHYLPGQSQGTPLQGLNLGRFTPLALDADGDSLYLSRLTEHGTYGISRYSLSQEYIVEEVFGGPEYDAIPPLYASANQRLILDRQHRLLGVGFETTTPRTVWLDPDFAQLQSSLDKVLPQRINQISAFSDDGQKLLIHSYSARHPGSIYTFDRAGSSLVKLIDLRPGLDGGTFSEMSPVKITARDGLVLQGYLTLPPGTAPKDQRLVIRIGTPDRRISYRFDSFVQFLSQRGFAVLSFNPRGTTGFGQAYTSAGDGQLNDGIQNDVEDMIKWARRTGLAAPRHIATFGHGLAGYLAVRSALKPYELPACVIAEEAPLDLPQLLENAAKLSTAGNRGNHAQQGLARLVGDDWASRGRELTAQSPYKLGNKLQRPILFIHNPQDPILDTGKLKSLVAELGKRNTGATLHLVESKSGTTGFDSQIAQWDRIEAFLRQHLGAPAGN